MRRSTLSRKLIALTAGVSLLAGGTALFRRNAEARRAARNRALVEAVSEGNLEQTAELLQAGADVYTRTPQRESLLFVAEGTRNPELILALAQRGLSVRERDAMGLTLLHRAARRGDTELLDALLRMGQPVNELDAKGRSALNHALRGARFEAAHLLLTHGADVHLGTPGEPPLQSLLSSDSLPGIRPKNPGGLGFPGTGTALPEREAESYLECVRELLRYGANPEARDAAGNSPIEVALSRRLWRTTRLLVETIGGWRDPAGRTALRVAAETGHDVGVDELSKIRNRPSEGAPAELVLAVWRGDRPRMRALLARGTDPNDSGIPGRTALGRAAARGDLEAVRSLLAAHARPEQPEAWGSPPHLACAHRHPSVVQALLVAGASVNTRSTAGRTPLHEAASTPFRMPGSSELPKTDQVREQQAIVRLLLQHRADPNARDSQGATPLQVALMYSGPPKHVVAQLLLEHGSSVSGAGTAEAPLFSAVGAGDVALVTMLLARGADINERSPRDGATPLWRATGYGQFKTMQFLASRGGRLPETVTTTVPMPGSARGAKRTETVADLIRKWEPSFARRRCLEALFPELRSATSQPTSYSETNSQPF